MTVKSRTRDGSVAEVVAIEVIYDGSSSSSDGSSSSDKSPSRHRNARDS